MALDRYPAYFRGPGAQPPVLSSSRFFFNQGVTMGTLPARWVAPNPFG